jgi:hypothetical protein
MRYDVIMETELTIKNKVKNPILIQHDDLKFDGKNITIPSYYVDTVLEYLKDWKLDGVPQVDIEDYQSFRNFLYDIQEYKNRGN